MNGGRIEKIIEKLDASEPEVSGSKLAGVAIVIQGKDPRVLLIERAVREGDPWSGQIAFPGGKMTEGDRTLMETAVRETKEELGLDLKREGRFAGYGGSFNTNSGSVTVVPSVFFLGNAVSLTPGSEVSSYRWIPLREIENSKTTRVFEFAGRRRELPAFVVGDYVIWGLTYRIIESIFSA